MRSLTDLPGPPVGASLPGPVLCDGGCGDEVDGPALRDELLLCPTCEPRLRDPHELLRQANETEAALEAADAAAAKWRHEVLRLREGVVR